MTLLFLLACGIDGPLATPNPPPSLLAGAEADVVLYTGVVSDVSGATRSFVLTGEGKRLICHLQATGTLRLGGQPAQVQDLVAGTSLIAEGTRDDDLLLVLRASDAPDARAAPVETPPETPPEAPAEAPPPTPPETPTPTPPAP